MKIKHALCYGLGAVTFLFFAACASSNDWPSQTTDDEELKVILPEGKADNFFSTIAQEYMATAQVEMTLSPADVTKTANQKMQIAQKLMPLKTRQVSWFLHLYLVDKSEDDQQANYGGLRAMVMYDGEENTNLRLSPTDPNKFIYDFRVQVGGTKRLLEKIRLDNNLGSESDTFPLRMAALPNEQLEELSHEEYKAGKWSPDTCHCDIETVAIKLTPIAPSFDAYLDYGKMIEDKVLDIAVHFGWDYHSRYDITHSKDVYQWLIDSLGFTSPTATYEKYNRLSGPLTKTVWFNGSEIAIRVHLFRPDPCINWNEAGPSGTWSLGMRKDENFKKKKCADYAWNDLQANANSTTDLGADHLMSDLKYSLASRDVIIFSGHSGYTYGFSLANWFNTTIGDLNPPQIKQITLPPDKSQIVMMNGCETYHTAQAFRDNPAKTNLRNLDLITTTSFSDATSINEVKRLLRALVGDENHGGAYITYSYGRLMRELNPLEQEDQLHEFTMYGIHGIDDNPRTNPLGDPQKTCQTCRIDRDCGAAGNVCIALNDQERVCAVSCISNSGCTSGQVCRQFGSLNTSVVLGSACVPTSLKCANSSSNTSPGSAGNLSPDAAAPLPNPTSDKPNGAPGPAEKSRRFTGSVKKGESKTFTVSLGISAKNIKVQMTGSGNADLSTRFGAAPTSSLADCKSSKKNSKETCKHALATSADLFISVRGVAAQASQFNVQVSWE